MMISRVILPLIFLVAFIYAGSISAEDRPLKIIPPKNGLYIGLYDWTGKGVEDFERLIGKKVAIWGNPPYIKSHTGQEGPLPYFDRKGHAKAYRQGYITPFSIESTIPSDTISPQAVIDGKIDHILKEIAKKIKAWNRPLFWLYQREPRIQPGPTTPGIGMNMGFGYDGGGYGLRGNETYRDVRKRRGNPKAEYGDPKKLDGPERYVDAARHIHDVVESIAPDHVTWVSGASINLNLVEKELKIKNTGAVTTYADFYPGDKYVDWHAFDYYSVAKDSFEDDIKSLWNEIMKVNPDKPVMILEFGVFKTMGSRARWFKDFFKSIKTTHRQVSAFFYWQSSSEEGEDERTRIDSRDPAREIWRNEMKKDWWVSNVRPEMASSRLSGKKLGRPPPSGQRVVDEGEMRDEGVMERVVDREDAGGEPIRRAKVIKIVKKDKRIESFLTRHSLVRFEPFYNREMDLWFVELIESGREIGVVTINGHSGKITEYSFPP